MALLEIPDQTISVYAGEIEEFEENDANSHFPYKIINIVALGILDLEGEKKIDFNEVEKRIEVKRLNRFPCVMFKIDNISVILQWKINYNWY